MKLGFCLYSLMWSCWTIGLGFLHQCRASLIIVFHDFAIVLIIAFLLSLSMGLSPKKRTKTFNNIVCFRVVLCVDHRTT